MFVSEVLRVIVSINPVIREWHEYIMKYDWIIEKRELSMMCINVNSSSLTLFQQNPELKISEAGYVM